jgi:hypothetical protein
MTNNFKEYRIIIILIIAYLSSVILVKPYNEINGLSFPINDEYFFALPILNLLELKKILVADGLGPWAIPQIMTGYLITKFFGFSFFNLRLISIFCACLNIVLIFLILKKNFKLNDKIILLTISSFIFFPPIYLAGITFMTEIFFFSILLLAFISYENYKYKSTSLNLLILNLIILLLFLQRQTGILFILFFIYISLFDQTLSKQKKKIFFFTSIFQITLFIIIHLLINNFIGNINPHKILIDLNTKKILSIIIHFPQILLYIGFLLIPFLFLKKVININFKYYKNFYYLLTFLLFISILILYLKFGKLMPYFDNVFSKYGSFRLDEILYGERDFFFNKIFYYFLTLASFVSLIFFFNILSKKKIKNLFHLLNQPIFFYGIITFIHSLIFFNTMNDRYIYTLLFSVIIYHSIFFDFANIKKKICFYSSWFLISFFFILSVITAKDMFRIGEASWIITNYTVNKYNLTPFNISGGHTWEWEKLKYLSKQKKRHGYIKETEKSEKNNYKYFILFGKYSDTVNYISYKRLNKLYYISVNKKNITK